MNRQQVALITGATGFIGNAVASALLARGFAVHALTSQDRDRAQLDPAISWFDFSEEGIAAAAAGATFFFHFSVVYDRPAVSDEEIERVNVQLPLRILAALSESGRQITCVFGDSFFRKFPVDATAQPRYTASKNRLAQALQKQPPGLACRCAMLVIEQVYGPSDSIEKVFPSVTKTLLEGKVKRLALTDGKQERDFVHRDDVVSAALTTAMADWTGYIEVPCGSGEATSVREVFTRLHALTESATELGFGDIPTNQQIDRSVADKNWLAARGWTAAKTLDAGLAELVEDIRQRVPRQDQAT